MIDTLREFCEDEPMPSFDPDTAFYLIKDNHDIYYQIFRAIVYYYLQRSETKKKCIMLYGAPNSGKSTISDYLEAIFDTYHMR